MRCAYPTNGSAEPPYVWEPHQTALSDRPARQTNGYEVLRAHPARIACICAL